MDGNENLKSLSKLKKKWGGQVGGVGLGGGQVGCERRIKVFVNIKKNGGEVGRGGGQDGCERRIEVFEKIHKNRGGGGGWGRGVRALGCSGWGCQGGCERRIEVFVNIQGSGGGSGWWGRVRERTNLSL